jgi:ABC-type sugar transport system ATPase subunit
MDNGTVLELKLISKKFQGVRALTDVSFKGNAGEILAVVGENGAGKSTLMKILSGVYPHGAYAGCFFLNGEEMHFSNIRESEAAGIQIIYQELALCKLMNVVENIFLGNEIKKKSGAIDWNESIRRAQYYLDEINLNVNPLTPVIQLGIGQQQLVEIAKALSKKSTVLILDEPTAALNEAESENLLSIMKNLRDKGVLCIFITHKLEEVFRCADRIVVLRDGQMVAEGMREEFTEDRVIACMVGRKLTERYPKEPHTAEKIIAEVKNWTVADPELPGRKLVKNVSFHVQTGEVLGIAGLMGAGRTELALSLFGCYHGYSQGTLCVDGRPLNPRNPRDAIKAGISYLSEDRKRFGLVLGMDIQDNVTITSLDKISKWGIVNSAQKASAANKVIRDMLIKTPSSEQVVKALSGGNQQKVVLGKWLMTKPKILILDEPTRGIDVGAKYEIYKIINKLVREGVAVVVISSELSEILGICDRILVMRGGEMVKELENKDVTQETVMFYATGGKEL